MTVAIVLSSVLLVLVLVLGLVLPAIADPMVPFGVRLPAPDTAASIVRRQTRLYRWRLLGSGVLAVAGSVTLYAATGEQLMLPLSVLVLVGAWYGCFILAHQSLRAAKTADNWYQGAHEGIAVDTELRTHPPRFPWLWLAPAVIIITATVTIGVINYPSMPAVLAMHYGANGVPNRVATKSIGTAFSLVFVQVGVTALLVGITAGIFHGRADLDPAHPTSSSAWFRSYMVLGVKALLGLTAAIDLGMLGSSLLMWSGTVTKWAPLVVVIPVLAGVLIAVVVLARNNRNRQVGDDETRLTHRDDDASWRGGLLYINRQDHALFVPRRYGIGWSVNLGNPRAAILLTGIAALITLLIVLRLGN